MKFSIFRDYHYIVTFVYLQAPIRLHAEKVLERNLFNYSVGYNINSEEEGHVGNYIKRKYHTYNGETSRSRKFRRRTSC